MTKPIDEVKYNNHSVNVVTYNGTPIWGKLFYMTYLDASDEGTNLSVRIYRYSSNNYHGDTGYLDFDEDNLCKVRYGDEIAVQVRCGSGEYIGYLYLYDYGTRSEISFTKVSDAYYISNQFTVTGSILMTVCCTYPQWRTIWEGSKDLPITGTAADFSTYIEGGFDTGLVVSDDKISSSWQYRITQYGTKDSTTGSTTVVSQQDVSDATNGVAYQVTGIANVYRFRMATYQGGQTINAIFYSNQTTLGVRVHSDNANGCVCHIIKVEAYY